MRLLLLVLALLALPSASAVSAAPAEADHPEARPFESESDASSQVDAALARSLSSDRRVIVVMGANWCHDSRGLAGWFAEPRFAAMLQEKYELVYVDVGFKDRNIDIAQRFGIKSIKGTPTVLILSPRGALLNRKSAPKWRNAASREEEDIFSYFDRFVPEL
ncbi:thioredoxin family protein [Parasphingorhabdus sp.]|uniref:thioredoxin family protein n=2 Tax=Parasphingorhabdus sp. TaxID=2709688 RepID=UPI003264FDBD